MNFYYFLRLITVYLQRIDSKYQFFFQCLYLLSYISLKNKVKNFITLFCYEFMGHEYGVSAIWDVMYKWHLCFRSHLICFHFHFSLSISIKLWQQYVDQINKIDKWVSTHLTIHAKYTMGVELEFLYVPSQWKCRANYSFCWSEHISIYAELYRIQHVPSRSEDSVCRALQS